MSAATEDVEMADVEDDSDDEDAVAEELGPLLFLFGFGFWGCDTARGPFREIALAAAVDVHVDLL